MFNKRKDANEQFKLYYFYTELLYSSDEKLAAIAEKSLKEVTYHVRRSSEWIVRLGDGTPESHLKMEELGKTPLC